MTTDSEEDRQELGVGEHLWALSQQPFARPSLFQAIARYLVLLSCRPFILLGQNKTL